MYRNTISQNYEKKTNQPTKSDHGQSFILQHGYEY